MGSKRIRVKAPRCMDVLVEPERCVDAVMDAVMLCNGIIHVHLVIFGDEVFEEHLCDIDSGRPMEEIHYMLQRCCRP